MGLRLRLIDGIQERWLRKKYTRRTHPMNTHYVTVTNSGLPEVDGLYVPSTEPPKESESEL